MELEKIIGLALGVYIVYWIIKVHWINVSSTRFERQQKQRAWIKPIVDDCVKTMNTELFPLSLPMHINDMTDICWLLAMITVGLKLN